MFSWSISFLGRVPWYYPSFWIPKTHQDHEPPSYRSLWVLQRCKYMYTIYIYISDKFTLLLPLEPYFIWLFGNVGPELVFANQEIEDCSFNPGTSISWTPPSPTSVLTFNQIQIAKSILPWNHGPTIPKTCSKTRWLDTCFWLAVKINNETGTARKSKKTSIHIVALKCLKPQFSD